MMKDKPIFIFGCRNSGTTMMARIVEKLGVFMGEPNELENSHGEVFWQRLAQGKLLRNEPVDILKESSDFIKNLDVVWGIKSPSFAFTIDKWLQKYPNARTIRIHREWKQPNKLVPHRTKQEWIAQRAEVTAEFFTRTGRFPTVNVFNIYYDTFVLNPIPEIQRLVSSFGLILTPQAKQWIQDFVYQRRSTLNG